MVSLSISGPKPQVWEYQRGKKIQNKNPKNEEYFKKDKIQSLLKKKTQFNKKTQRKRFKNWDQAEQKIRILETSINNTTMERKIRILDQDQTATNSTQGNNQTQNYAKLANLWLKNCKKTKYWDQKMRFFSRSIGKWNSKVQQIQAKRNPKLNGKPWKMETHSDRKTHQKPRNWDQTIRNQIQHGENKCETKSTNSNKIRQINTKWSRFATQKRRFHSRNPLPNLDAIRLQNPGWKKPHKIF